MTSEHTAGPWEIEYDNYGNESYSEWYNILSPTGVIAQVGQCRKLTKEQKANARLISSCPELLEACKAIVRDFEDEDESLIIPASSCVHVPNHTDLCPYWLAKQAIAKAEGKEVER